MKDRNNAIKLLVFNIFGIFMFFININIGGKSTIPIDHIVTWVRNIPYAIPIYGTIMIIIGTVLPFVDGRFKKSKTDLIFSIINIVGLTVTLMVIFNFGPKEILAKNMAPFIFKVVVVPVIMLIPIGSVFLAFLVDYGLMEITGVLMRPIMRPLFKTPGRSAVDAVASFVGSYSIALLVTNGVYKDGGYTKKEAAIIATGFSTVSATFMIILANTLGIMQHWNLYFWITIIITFIVTGISARLYPLRNFPNTYYNNKQKQEEEKIEGSTFKRAWTEGMKKIETVPRLEKNILKNFKLGLKMALNVGPIIMGIGIIALYLAYYTPVFDVLAYIFYPITSLFRIPDAFIVAKASVITLADMYTPAILVTELSLFTRFLVGILCISELLFFAGMIPCVLATDIGISVKDIVIIWFFRVVLTLVIAIPVVYLLMGGIIG